MQNRIPIRFKAFIIVNPPWVFAMLFAIMSPFLKVAIHSMLVPLFVSQL